MCQQFVATRRGRFENHSPDFVCHCFYFNSKVRNWNAACSVIWPFSEFEARCRENVTEAGVVPFAWVAETIEVEVKDGQAIRRFVRLDNRIGRAFDAPGDTECPKKMPNESCFSGTEVAVQRDESIAQRWRQRQPAGEGVGVGLAAPLQRGEARFYNRRVVGTQLVAREFVARELVARIGGWARDLGFSQIGIAGIDLSDAEAGLAAWLHNGFHGEMDYMAAHGLRRARPAELVPGTVSVITARMDYLPRATAGDWQAVEFARLQRPGEAVVSVYARGRDYHKVLRARLQKLAERMAAELGPFGHRVFTDSAPVLEAELASRSGQGWRGKHTLVLDREAGSMFFLGEIYVDLALPASAPVTAHCGSCSACIDVCPTQAIIAPHRLDARRCISYLTIEHGGAIPVELRPLIGNRIYGCDDCQLICPWNKFAKKSALPDFDARDGLSGRQLCELFAWSEDVFLRFTEGSPIRRIGHERWLRNIAVALGNALRQGDAQAEAALRTRVAHPGALVREHVEWALAQGAFPK